MQLYRAFVIKGYQGKIRLGVQVAIKGSIALDLGGSKEEKNIVREDVSSDIKSLVEARGGTFEAVGKSNGFRLRDVVYYRK